MQVLCVKCKGRGHCGRQFCPIITKSEAMFKVADMTKKDFFGSAPAPFVGRFGYPYVNVGILAPPEVEKDTWMYDAPKAWAAQDIQIKKIVDYRSSLVNSRFESNVKKPDKMLDIGQQVGMASKPVDMEINLKNKPKFFMDNQPNIIPMGPKAELKKASVTENPKINFRVDKVVDDIDLKSMDAMLYLRKHDFDENFLSRVLSVGVLGVKKSRRLVPTRWSITAVDDGLGKNIIKKIKDYNDVDFMAYFGGYLGNYYLILFFSDVWSYELFETYLPNSSWNQSDKISFVSDFESYSGRKGYAENTAGGYYAARLPVLERLNFLRRQGSVLCLRFITGEYSVPLGVWVCREAARKALQSKPTNFADREEMLTYARNFIKEKFDYDLDNILRESSLLKNIKQQSKLTQFF